MRSLSEEIRQLISEHKWEAITAEFVVEQAKNIKKWPHLNVHLWQVPEAELAAEARLSRAHRLLISVRIISAEGEPVRMMVHTRGEEGYRHVETLAHLPDLAALKLRQLSEDIARARGRLHAFQAMLTEDVAISIDRALKTAERRAVEAADRREKTAA